MFSSQRQWDNGIGLLAIFIVVAALAHERHYAQTPAGRHDIQMQQVAAQGRRLDKIEKKYNQKFPELRDEIQNTEKQMILDRLDQISPKVENDQDTTQ